MVANNHSPSPGRGTLTKKWVPKPWRLQASKRLPGRIQRRIRKLG